MTTTTKIVLGAVVVLLIGWGVWSGQKPHEASGETLKVGAILSLTSFGAQDGESIKQGLDLAKKDLAAQGVNVDISYFDDGTDAKQSATGAQQLAAQGVSAIFGPQWSFLMDSALPIIDSKKIVAFSPSNTSEVVHGTSPYVFYGYTKNEKKIAPLVAWLKEHQVKKVAIIVNSIAWGTSHAEVYTKAVGEVGGTVVLSEQVNYGGEKDVIPTLLLKAKNAGAEAIFWSGSYDGDLIIAQKMSELGLKIPFLADEEIALLVKQGKLTPGASQAIYTFYRDDHPAFVSKFKAEYGTEPLHYADSSYDMLMLFVQAEQKRGATPLKDYLHSFSGYTGLSGTYRFDEKGDITSGEWKIKQL